VGTVIERLAYEPFGKRRFTTGQFDQTGTIDATSTTRGFTGHEHLDSLDFIHMNARVYDPDIGRFLSPDPTVPYADNPQSFNRYSYVMNNPLNRYDPTGFADDANDSGKDVAAPSEKGCNTCSLSKESVSNAITQPPSTNANMHDKQSATVPDADKTAGQNFNAEIARSGREIAKNGEVAIETTAKEGFFAVFFGGIGRAIGGLVTNAGRFAGKVAEVFRGGKGAAATAEADVAKLATTFQKDASQIIAKDGTKITGFTKHGVDRAVGDDSKRAGTRPAAILDALKDPKNIKQGVDSQNRPFTVYQGENARVVVNPETGKVISTNPLSRAGAN
jgi:RHS repeat-associated protein